MLFFLALRVDYVGMKLTSFHRDAGIIVAGRGSRVAGRKSRVAGRKSRVKSRGSRVKSRGSILTI